MSVLQAIRGLLAPDPVAELAADAAQGEVLRGHQAANVIATTPWMVLACIVNVVVTVWALWAHPARELLLGWAGLSLSLMGVALWSTRRHLGRPVEPRPTRSTGKATRNAERTLKTVITVAEQAGAEAVILACTELEMVVDVDANVLPIYDTARIHCEVAANWSMGDEVGG